MKNSTTLQLTNPRKAFGLIMVICCLSQVGCITTALNTISASRLPMELRGCPKSELVPINLASLQNAEKEDDTVDAGDVLAVFVPGIVPNQVDLTPIVGERSFINRIYYPPGGTVQGPAFGVPIRVNDQGMLQLPLITPLNVQGMTLTEISEQVVNKYLEAGMLKDVNALAQVTILKHRVHRVTIFRQDVLDSPVYKNAGATIVSERGTSEIVDLPTGQNDVLHALYASGGLPGTDGDNRIWVFRAPSDDADQKVFQQNVLNAAQNNDWVTVAKTYRATCIPMRIRQGQPLPFLPQDVILGTGDIVYVEGQKHQWFYTGGYMPAGQFALPRNTDVDVLEAIAMANGQIGFEPLGLGFGNFRTPPTQVVVVRKLADGQQFRIRVDLAKATHNANERILIQPDDLLLVYYKPGQRAANSVLEYGSAAVADLLSSAINP